MTFASEVTVEGLERDPYPIYARLRSEAPVAYLPAVNLWFVTRFKDVEFVSKSPDHHRGGWQFAAGPHLGQTDHPDLSWGGS